MQNIAIKNEHFLLIFRGEPEASFTKVGLNRPKKHNFTFMRRRAAHCKTGE